MKYFYFAIIITKNLPTFAKQRPNKCVPLSVINYQWPVFLGLVPYLSVEMALVLHDKVFIKLAGNVPFISFQQLAQA